MKKALAILLIVTLMLAIVVGCGTTIKEEFEATVVDIEVSAGGFGHSTIYVVEFDNGKKFAFETGVFVVGNKYYVACSFNRGFGSAWNVKEIKLLEKSDAGSK